MKLIACVTIASVALSAATTSFADETQGAYPENEAWTFQLSPYFWFSGMTGDVAVNDRLPVIDVDISFDQIFNNIAWWPPPVMLAGEARKGDFAFVSDFIFLGLEADAERVVGPVALSAQLDLDNIIATLFTSFRLLQNDSWSLDFLAGGRLWSVDAQATLNLPLAVHERSGGKLWVDPMVGLVGKVDLGSGFGLHLEGDIGGFGLASDLDWQAVGLVQYAIGESTSVEVGYRHLAVDFSDGPFLYDVEMSGPIIGVRFRF